jgi:hypothetical protein
MNGAQKFSTDRPGVSMQRVGQRPQFQGSNPYWRPQPVPPPQINPLQYIAPVAPVQEQPIQQPVNPVYSAWEDYRNAN